MPRGAEPDQRRRSRCLPPRPARPDRTNPTTTTTRDSRPASSETTSRPTIRQPNRPPQRHAHRDAYPHHRRPGAHLLRWSSAIPSLVEQVKGWHARPGKETVTSTLLLTASSITLRN